MRCNNRDIELYMKGKKDGKEELQQENKELKEEMKVLFEENNNKEQVIIKYQDNWNELKMYCYEHYYGITTNSILQKMEELEKGEE